MHKSHAHTAHGAAGKRDRGVQLSTNVLFSDVAFCLKMPHLGTLWHICLLFFPVTFFAACSGVELHVACLLSDAPGRSCPA